MSEHTLSSSLIERLKKIQTNQEQCTLASYDLLYNLRETSDECLQQPITGQTVELSERDCLKRNFVEGCDPLKDISIDNKVSTFEVTYEPSKFFCGYSNRTENNRNSNLEDSSNGNSISENFSSENTNSQKTSSENINIKDPTNNRKFSYLKKGQGLSRFRSRAFKGFKGRHNNYCSSLETVNISKPPDQLDQVGESQRENPNDFEQLEQLVSHASFCSDSSTVLELLQRDCSTPLSCKSRPVHTTDNEKPYFVWPVGNVLSSGNAVVPARTHPQNQVQEARKANFNIANIDNKPFGVKGKHLGILKKSEQSSPSMFKVTLERAVKVLEYEVDDEQLNDTNYSEDATIESINISDPEIIPFLIENFCKLHKGDPPSSSPVENFHKLHMDSPPNSSPVNNFCKLYRNDPSNSSPIRCNSQPSFEVNAINRKEQQSISKTSYFDSKQSNLSEDDCRILMLAKIYELEKEIEIFRKKNKAMEELNEELQLEKRKHISNFKDRPVKCQEKQKHISNFKDRPVKCQETQKHISNFKDRPVQCQEKVKPNQGRGKPTLKLNPQRDKAVSDEVEVLKKELDRMKIEYSNLKRMFANMQRQIVTSKNKQDARLESNLETCSKSRDLNHKTSRVKRPPLLNTPAVRSSTSKPKAIQVNLEAEKCTRKKAIVIEKTPKQLNSLSKVITLAYNNNNNRSDEVNTQTETLDNILNPSSPTSIIDTESYFGCVGINERSASSTSDSHDIVVNPRELYYNNMDGEISTIGNYKKCLEGISRSGYLHENPIKEHQGKMVEFRKGSCLSTILEESISYSNRNSISEVKKFCNDEFASISTQERTESKNHLSRPSAEDRSEIRPNALCNLENGPDTRKSALFYQTVADRSKQQTFNSPTEEITKMEGEMFLKSGENKPEVVQPISILKRLAPPDDSIEIVDVIGKNVTFSETEEIEEIIKVIQHNNGDKEIIYSSKKVYHYAANNSFRTVFSKDGREEYRFANGQREIYYRDGSYEIRQPDQSGKFVYEDGTEVSVFSNGAKVTVYKSGLKIIDFPNGKKEVHELDCTRLLCPDGTIKTIFKDGRQETQYSNGLIRLKDLDGNVKMHKVDRTRFTS